MAGRIRKGVEHMYVIVDSQDNHSPEWKGEAEFSRCHLATSTSFGGSIDDACNEHLEKLCIRNSIDSLFNMRDAKVTAYDKKKSCKDIMECIDHFRDVYPYVRYSYIDNVFRYYQMREVSRRYQNTLLRIFNDALKESVKLQKLFQRWFPTSTVHPYVPSEEMRNAAALDYLVNTMGIFKPGRQFSQEEHDAIIHELNRIYGTNLSRPADLMKKVVPYTLKRVGGESDKPCYNMYRCVPNPKAQAKVRTVEASTAA